MAIQTQARSHLLSDNSVPALLTQQEQKSLNFYKDKAYNARTATETRIYNKRMEALILKGKSRALSKRKKVKHN